MIGKVWRKVKGLFSGSDTSGAALLFAGWSLERFWEQFEKLGDWMEKNPKATEKIQHAITYVKQWASKKPAPTTYDIFQDAMTRLAEDDPELSDVLGDKLTNIRGIPPDPSNETLNAAQNLFVVMAVQFPQNAEDLGTPEKREWLIDATYKRLRMYAMMSPDAWKDWADILNLTAPERERAFIALLKQIDEEVAGMIDEVRTNAVQPIREVLTDDVADQVSDWADALHRFSNSRNIQF